ncbi:MAG: LPP20 family lipoprotein [Prevotella sp.]|nr:LPP20 family lipoprotein [Prevotella sp.]
MKRKLGCMLLMLLPLWAAAQKPLDEIARIKASDDYIWGEGRGDTDAKATQSALNDLISKISVTVQSETSLDMQSINDGKNVDSKSAMEAVIKTYSTGSLTNTKSIFVTHEPNAYVFRYMEKDELEKIFEEREDRILSYVYTAQNAEREGRIDDALRNYYWGFCLLKSLQHPNKVKLEQDGVKHTLMVWIPEQINQLLGNIKTEVAKIEGNVVDLLITYKGKPVTSLDFRFMDGQNYSFVNSAKDGISQIELNPASPTDKLQLKYEYEFTGQMRQDRELEMVMDVFNPTPFPKATVVVNGGSKKEMKVAMMQFQEAVTTMSEATHATVVEKPSLYAKTVNQIITAIKSRKYDQVKPFFTDEGYDMFTRLINYGTATILGNPQLHFYRLSNRVICRSVPMKFAFKNNKRSFVEDVTFTFNDRDQIESIAFGLDKAARDDIFNREARGWNDSIRMVIATFLENYKTAFALKRADYIKSIFDDDAIIIVGHVIRKAQKTAENDKYLDNEMVKHTRLSKKEYIRNVERSFKSNEFINIRFTDNDVKKMGVGADTYGIQIHQDYYSSSYADTGYLFLMVDLNDPDLPCIKVRTWQPKRDPNINSNFDKSDRYYGLIYGGNF